MNCNDYDSGGEFDPEVHRDRVRAEAIIDQNQALIRDALETVRAFDGSRKQLEADMTEVRAQVEGLRDLVHKLAGAIGGMNSCVVALSSQPRPSRRRGSRR